MRPQRMKEFEFRLGKLGLVLFVVGISFLLFLAFAMGVVVGVNMESNPEQAARGIPEILRQKVARSAEGEAVKATGDEGRKAEGAEKDKFPLTFFDTLTKGKGAASSEPAQPKAKKEESRREEAAPEKAVAASASAGKFVIQVASLQDRKKAEDLRARLEGMGHNPYIDSAELSDRGRWYRVKLRGFETKEEAQKVVDGLQGKIKGLQCMILPAGS